MKLVRPTFAPRSCNRDLGAPARIKSLTGHSSLTGEVPTYAHGAPLAMTASIWGVSALSKFLAVDSLD